MEIVGVILCISFPVFTSLSIYLGVIVFKERQKSKIERERFRVALAEMQVKISNLSKSAMSGVRENWLVEIKDITYRNELEVEIKFIYPLMRFLGYAPSELKTRVPVEIQTGRKRTTVVADWVIYLEKPYLVIEAKEPGQALSDSVQEQARSYAYGLGAPLYMLVNGKALTVFERRLDADTIILHSTMNDLIDKWDALESLIGKK